MDPEQFSVMQEAKKAISRLKDTAVKNGFHSIPMRGLSEDQADAVATTISLARALAIASRLDHMPQGLSLKVIRGAMTSHTLSSDADGETVANFPVVPENILAFVERAESVPAYAVEQQLPAIATTAFMLKRNWGGTRMVDFDNNGTEKEGAVLLNANVEIMRINALLLSKAMKAHGFDDEKTVRTCSDGLNVERIESVTTGKVLTGGTYPYVLMEKEAYTRVITRENTLYRSGPS